MSKSIIIFLLMSTCLYGQEVKTISVITAITGKDTTYRFQEKVMADGVELSTRSFPEKWLSKTEMLNFIYDVGKSYNQKVLEIQRAQALAEKDWDYYVGLLDTILGSGTYQTNVNQEVLNSVQGTWVLLVQQKDKQPVKHILVISGNTISYGDKTGTFTVLSINTATMFIDKVAPNVNFTRQSQDVWAGKIDDDLYVLRKNG